MAYIKHNHTKGKHAGGQPTPEYNVWMNIKRRCLVPTNPEYPNYGGRGITICEAWQSDFAAFLAEVGLRPGPDYQIDRRDNNKGYEPGNVRWVTRSEQQRNRRNSTLITYGGETRNLVDWAAKLGMNVVTFCTRLQRWPLERVFTEPVNERMRRKRR